MTWRDLVGRPTNQPPTSDASTQELLLAMFGAYLRPRTELMWSGGLVEALELFGVKSSAGRVALARLVNRGLTYRRKRGRFVAYGLTDYGLHVLEDSDERVASLRDVPRNGSRWTIVWHALPDSRKEERSHFMRQLRFHGFGQLQDGVWAAPHDYVTEVSDLAERMEVIDQVVVFGSEEPRGALAPLADHVWRLDNLAAAYAAFADHFGAASRPGLDAEQEVFRFCTQLIVGYRAFVESDPGLPMTLTSHWQERERATQTYRSLLGELEDVASRYFLAMTSAVSDTGEAIRW